MRKHIPILSIVFILFLSVFVAPVYAQPEVTGVRLGQNGETTRFVIDISEDVDFSTLLLASPYRIVVDLPEVEWRIGSSGQGDGRGLISRYRYGLFQPGTSRLVLDLEEPAIISRSFTLNPQGPYRYRLVIDLAPATEAAFRQAMTNNDDVLRVVDRTDRPAVRQAQRSGKKVVVIDPGHGGVDPGTISVIGVSEKNVVLDIAREVKRVLEADGGYEVVLTRDTDVYIPLRQRFAQARAAGADLFISIHADAIGNSRVRGATVYTLSESASDSEAAALARKENRSDAIAGINLDGESDDVASILIDLAQRETMNLSARFAGVLIPELRSRVRVRNNTHRFAGFVVLKAPDVPSILLEVGYMSNRDDSRFLTSREGQRSVADAITQGVKRYFSAVASN